MKRKASEVAKDTVTNSLISCPICAKQVQKASSQTHCAPSAYILSSDLMSSKLPYSATPFNVVIVSHVQVPMAVINVHLDSSCQSNKGQPSPIGHQRYSQIDLHHASP